MFDVDTQICNYAEIVDNCERGERVPECTDELRDNSVCREQQQADNLDLPVGRPRPTVCVWDSELRLMRLLNFDIDTFGKHFDLRWR